MEDSQRKRIKTEYENISDAIKKAVNKLAAFLYETDILSKLMRDDIIYKPISGARAAKLLELLPRQDPRAFAQLYGASLSLRLFRVADTLEPMKAPHEISGSHLSVLPPNYREDPLPDTWPDDEFIEKVRSSSLQVRKVTADEYGDWMKKKFEDKENVYNMSKPKKGRVVIFDNNTFNHGSGLRTRAGTEYDVKGLTDVFDKLGFHIKTHENKTKKEIEGLLEKENKYDHSKYNCFVVIFLSHGVRGLIAAKDSNSQSGPKTYLEISKVKMTIADIPTLKGKPKLIFIQACRHDGGIEGSPYADGCAILQDGAAMPLGSGYHSRDMPDSSLGKPDQANDFRSKMEDLFVAQATTPGNKSFRSSYQGSWFIQAVIWVFEKYARYMDIHALITKVNRLVRNAKCQKDDEILTQVCEATTSLNKEFFFFPGLSAQESA